MSSNKKLLMFVLFGTALAGCASMVQPGGGNATSELASGSNSKFTHTEVVAVSADRVWRVWTDVPAWPRWDIELASAQIDGPFIDGATGRLTPKRGPSAKFKISDVTYGKAYTMTTELPGGRLVIKRELKAVPEGTQFTHEVSFAGLTGPVFASIYGSDFRRALPVAMRNIAALAKQP